MLKLLATTTLLFTLLSNTVYAQFDKKCQLNKISYLSPAIGGCTFRIDNSGKAFFKKYNRDVNVDQCLSSFLKGKKLIKFKKEISDMQKGFNSNIRKNPILYLVEENGGYSGKLSNETLGIGLNIHLKVNNNAKLSLVGGFGRVNMTGPCKPYNS